MTTLPTLPSPRANLKTQCDLIQMIYIYQNERQNQQKSKPRRSNNHYQPKPQSPNQQETADQEIRSHGGYIATRRGIQGWGHDHFCFFMGMDLANAPLHN